MLRDPMPSPADLQRMYADAYSPSVVKTDESGFESRDAMLRELVAFLSQRCFRPGDRVLDFGAGQGRFCAVLRENSLLAEGVEPAAQAREEAMARYGFEFRADLSEMPTNHYDWAIAVEVLEHLAEPLETLRQLRDALKPGGGLFLTTPNARGLMARLSGAEWREAHNPFHLVLYTEPGLRTLLERAGFERVTLFRFSPLGVTSPYRAAAHRILQLFRLYGGIRVAAYRP